MTRYQHLNLADALEKVRNIIRMLDSLEKAEPSEESQERARKLSVIISFEQFSVEVANNK